MLLHVSAFEVKTHIEHVAPRCHYGGVRHSFGVTLPAGQHLPALGCWWGLWAWVFTILFRGGVLLVVVCAQADALQSEGVRV